MGEILCGEEEGGGGGDGRRRWLMLVKGGMTHPSGAFQGFAAFFSEGEDVSVPSVEVGEELF